jgi:adenine deaminase
MKSFIVEGNYVDIEKRLIFPASLEISNGRISKITKSENTFENYIIPGFIDSHVHIESSMLLPSEFAKIAVVHGTVGTVSDPHEIANVCGIEGVEFMIQNGKTVPFHFNFGAPSCVPATKFETAGAEIDSEGIEKLLQRPEIKYLSEMMNYPGVIYNDAEVLEKIAIAHRCNKPVDGHAPGLSGENLKKYFSHGISTDHECFTYNEGLEKARLGMKILIREGSAAKNFNELIPLLSIFPDQIMFCSDDKHPDDLLEGHINQLVKRAVDAGYDMFDVLKAACVNPVKHYKLEIGMLQTGDSADFIIIDNLTNFKPIATYIRGEIVAENQRSNIKTFPEKILINKFNTGLKEKSEFLVIAKSEKINVIVARDGQLVTEKEVYKHSFPLNSELQSSTEDDILKLVVVNRYSDEMPAIAFIKNFGLKYGAIASCVGHDSHNITAVGTNDEDICNAVNLIIKNKGGISFAHHDDKDVLELPIGGIMSNKAVEYVAEGYTRLTQKAKSAGSKLNAPYMTLSFMALLVIPKLKLSDLGLFDGEKFEFIPLES